MDGLTPVELELLSATRQIERLLIENGKLRTMNEQERNLVKMLNKKLIELAEDRDALQLELKECQTRN